MRSAVELLSSMRFSISLLTVICIASVIGTVLKQHEPVVNYVNQFGPFWAQLFMAVKLNAVYSAWWFLLILAFLVASTSLCIARNTPKIIADLKAYKENLREQSLQAFHHRAHATLGETPEAAAQRIGKTLAGGGWKVKLQKRDSGWMVAAKAGGANKLGYLAAHSAIVLVCIGGLLDGDLIVRAQMLLGGKTPYTGGGMIADVQPQHRLSATNPTFRGNLLVAEGTQSGTAILNQSDGILLQELPFSIELKKFIVEHYSTGMPKLFASEIVIHDRETGEKIPARVEVNHPARHRGIEIYQSSFDDGGSSVRLSAVPMNGNAKPFEIEGVIGGSSQLTRGQGDGAEKMTLEYTGLRVINVENFGNDKAGTDVRKVDLRDSLEGRLGAANKTATKKELRNVGPSIMYKLRDASGQAREFHNYMLPVDMGDGSPVFLMGLRDTPAEPFRYLRVPADDQGGLDGFLQLRAAMADACAARARGAPLRGQGDRCVAARTGGPAGGLGRRAPSRCSPEPIRRASRSRPAARAFRRCRTSSRRTCRRPSGSAPATCLCAYSMVRCSSWPRSPANAPAKSRLEPSEKTQAFMTQAVLALSDVHFYPAPMAFQLKDFTQVQASVFQVTRTPGRNIVYLGCALLILGVFAMLYVRERRVWCWLSGHAAGAEATMALSSNRKTMEADREFALLKERLLRIQA